MKKPDITIGKWEECLTPQVRAIGRPHRIIADCRNVGIYEYKEGEAQANAQAIKEVPNLIDDLIEIIRIYEAAPDTSTLDTDLDPAINKARQTLKKAGCHD